MALIFFLACNRSAQKQKFTKAKEGYWYQLVAFSNDNDTIFPGHSAWINAVFLTQDDSVFYDSENDLKDRFYIRTDTVHSFNFLKSAVSKFTEGDSLCILIKPKDFFQQQFKSDVPFFCTSDSVVKINLKIKKTLTSKEYAILLTGIANNEVAEIETFYPSLKEFEQARDPSGFYWVQKPEAVSDSSIRPGCQVSLEYEGGFLNGRIIDRSPPEFRIIYGTPDQVLKGLNYVIAKLKKGQTSKIILPSQLAFGENGSSNGSVPPFTPMLYKIKITDIK